MKKNYVPLIILAALILIAVVFCLWYTRPQTLEALCPAADLSQPIQMTGVYPAQEEKDDGSVDSRSVTVELSEEDMEKVMELLQSLTWRRKLESLFIGSGGVTTWGPKWSLHTLFSGGDTLILTMSEAEHCLTIVGGGAALKCRAKGMEDAADAIYELLENERTKENN